MAVAYFPDAVVRPIGADPITSRKVIFGNPREYLVKSWLTGAKPSTIQSGVMPAGKEPADAFAVPLAVDPSGKRVVVTGPVDPRHGQERALGVVGRVWRGEQVARRSQGGGRRGRVVEGRQDDPDRRRAGVVIAWDAGTFKEKSRIAVRGRVAAVAISPDGKTRGGSGGLGSGSTPRKGELQRGSVRLAGGGLAGEAEGHLTRDRRWTVQGCGVGRVRAGRQVARFGVLQLRPPHEAR